MDSRPSSDQRRRVEAVLEAAERTETLAELLSSTVAALDEHLGYRVSAFMLCVATPNRPGQRAYAGADHGQPEYVFEEYFERWADADAFGSEVASEAFRSRGMATTEGLYPRLGGGERRFVDDFLRRNRVDRQLAVRLPSGWTDGYLTLAGPEPIDERDVALLSVIAPRLTELLRAQLPVGLDGVLSVRESQVAELLSLGFPNGAIAATLNVEEDTVKKHVSSALSKLGLERRTQLAVTWATGRRLDLGSARQATP